MPLIGRIVLCLTLCAIGIGISEANSYAWEKWLRRDREWIPEVQFNTLFLAHVGTSTIASGPSTGFNEQMDFAVWWRHLIRFQIHGSHSLTGDSSWGLGGGIKINLLELGVRSDDGNLGGYRGVFSLEHQTLLVHLGCGATHYWFATLNPASVNAYPLDQTIAYVTAGIQWGIGWDIYGADRVFIESTVAMGRMGGIFYALPYLGLGVSF